MSFTFYEIVNSILGAIGYGVLFSAFWMLPSVIDLGIVKLFGVISFFVGFILLSYFCLDGMLRIYMFVISLSVFLLSKKYIFDKIINFLKIMIKAVKKIPIFGKNKETHPLDKAMKK